VRVPLEPEDPALIEAGYHHKQPAIVDQFRLTLEFESEPVIWFVLILAVEVYRLA